MIIWNRDHWQWYRNRGFSTVLVSLHSRVISKVFVARFLACDALLGARRSRSSAKRRTAKTSMADLDPRSARPGHPVRKAQQAVMTGNQVAYWFGGLLIFIWNPYEVYSWYIPCTFLVYVGQSTYTWYILCICQVFQNSILMYFLEFQCSKPMPWLRAIECRRQNFSTQHNSP